MIGLNGGRYKYLTFCFNIVQYSKTIGILAINIDSEMFVSFIGGKRADEILVITDREGKAVFSNDAMPENIQSILDSAISYSEFDRRKPFYSNKDICVSAPIKNYPATLYAVSEQNTFQSVLSNFFAITLISVICTILGLLILSYFGSMHFYHFILELVEKFEAPSKINESDKKFNETRYITYNIFKNIKDKSNIQIKLTESIALLKKAQSIALQTQITPHFIFNTLNIISALEIERIGEDNDIVRIIGLMSDIIFFTLNTKESIVPIEEEFEYTRKYVTIEQIRNSGGFDVEWDISANVSGLNVLKMILQPLVENAVWHGLKLLPRGKRGTIKIEARSDGKLLTLVVRDNGIGIAEDKLREINSKLNSDELHETAHIGLFNTNRRIKLIFGKRYGCRIELAEQYTNVIVTLPANGYLNN
jgi:two-component system sensor histidine kinase YesM